jgi:hypothetical protein
MNTYRFASDDIIRDGIETLPEPLALGIITPDDARKAGQDADLVEALREDFPASGPIASR